MYIHDDMVLNLTSFAAMNNNWTSNILYSGYPHSCDFTSVSYTWSTLPRSDPGWYHWTKDLLKWMRLAEFDARIPKRFLTRLSNGKIRWFPHCQSDFVYVPFAVKDAFIAMADWLTRNYYRLITHCPMRNHIRLGIVLTVFGSGIYLP